MSLTLLWDVDGTLAETERDGHRVAFNLAFAELGLPWGWDERRYGELLHVTGGRERLLADMATRPDAPTDPAARAALAARLHALKNERYAALVEEGRLQLRPGVGALLRAARDAGWRQAIVTTTSRANAEVLLARLFGRALEGAFECRVCGEDVARKKPDPEAYRLALARLGVAASEALALEDSTPGAAAAAAAGVPVLLRPSAYFASATLPDGAAGTLWQDALTLPDLRQLQALQARHRGLATAG